MKEAAKPKPDQQDRYVARLRGIVWVLWDTRRNAPVFGVASLREDTARAWARRLAEASCPRPSRVLPQAGHTEDGRIAPGIPQHPDDAPQPSDVAILLIWLRFGSLLHSGKGGSPLLCNVLCRKTRIGCTCSATRGTPRRRL